MSLPLTFADIRRRDEGLVTRPLCSQITSSIYSASSGGGSASEGECILGLANFQSGVKSLNQPPACIQTKWPYLLAKLSISSTLGLLVQHDPPLQTEQHPADVQPDTCVLFNFMRTCQYFLSIISHVPWNIASTQS